MFGWFRPKCPVEPRIQRWIEARMGWLVGEIGWEDLVDRPIILPSDDYFPDAFDGSEDSARVLFVRTCHYMGMNSADFELAFYRPGPTGKYHPRLIKPKHGWTGLYEGHSLGATIWLETSHLDDPESLVATFAHELCHAFLLGGKRINRDQPDLEPLTDLATVVFGLGVFAASVAFRSRSYHAGAWEYFSASSQGYLTPPMWSYGLALFAWLRREEDPAWIGHLHASVRSDCREALEYLQDVEETLVTPGESLEAVAPLGALLDEAKKADSEGQRLSRDEEVDGLCEETIEEKVEEDEEEKPLSDADPELLADPFQDPFTQGVLRMQEGDWDSAFEAFSEAIRCNPEDGESYQQRSLAQLELGRTREALADAERAVRLAPDDSESYFARGLARLQARRYREAIGDLGRYLDEEDIRLSSGHSPSKALYFRGLAHAALGDLRQAVADYTTAISRWPNWPEPFEARAAAYQELGYVEKAATDRQEAARLARI